MAYTTEEQDFQSFMTKFRQALPMILTFLAVGAATYAAINWWKSHQANAKLAEYQQFNQVMSAKTDQDNVKIDLIKGFVNEYPKESLAAIAVLNTARDLEARGKYEEALKLFETLSPENDFSPELVALDKAKLLFQLGRADEAIALLDKVKEGEWYVNARTLAGDILYTSHKYKLSLAEYTKARDYLEGLIAKNEPHSNQNNYENQVRFVQARLNIVQSLAKKSLVSSVPATEAPASEAPAESNSEKNSEKK